MSSKQVVVEPESVARHEIENVLHTHLYPGSEVMADSKMSQPLLDNISLAHDG